MVDIELPPGVEATQGERRADVPQGERRGDLRRSEDRRQRLSTAQAVFWAVLGASVVLFLFFVALGALNPKNAPAAFIAAAVLAFLWLLHSWRRLWAGGLADRTSRERRGF